jgi:Spy/CpxP family protein refolding chaperone
MNKRTILSLVTLVAFAAPALTGATALAQQSGPLAMEGPGPNPAFDPAPPPEGQAFGGERGGMGGGMGAMHGGVHGMWWKNPRVVQEIGLTPDQQKRMEDTLQQSRLQLIDLKANVERQELLLRPLLDQNPPDTAKVLAQVDKLAQARADLEKSNARMLLGIRTVLTPEQWTKLQAMRHNWQSSRGRGPMEERGEHGNGQGGHRGPGDGQGPGGQWRNQRTPPAPGAPPAPGTPSTPQPSN